jgi:hypothetical protein
MIHLSNNYQRIIKEKSKNIIFIADLQYYIALIFAYINQTCN